MHHDTSMLRQLLRTAGWACGLGALFFGGPVAVAHVLHNPGLGWWRALLLTLELFVLYGVGGGLAITFLGGLAFAVRRVWRRRRRAERRLGATSQAQRWGPLGLGFVALQAIFWSVSLLYGLTYGQTVLVHPQAFWGMAGYLVLATVLVAVSSAALAWTMVLLGRQLVRRKAGLRILSWVAALELAVALGCGLAGRWQQQGAEPARDAAPRVVASTASLEAAEATASADRASSGAQLSAGNDLRVILVGLDGLDPDVLKRLEAEGALPTFARLRRMGISTRLHTLPDANSAVLWASIYTGEPPRAHGVLDFYRVALPGIEPGVFPVHRTWFKEAASYLEPLGLAERHVVARPETRRPLLWEIVDVLGRSSGVVDGYLYSYPASVPRSAGSFVLAGGLDYLATQLRQGSASKNSLPLYVQPPEILERAGNLPRDGDFAWQAKATLALLDAGRQPDLLNVYAHQPDLVQHESWHRFEPEKYPPWRRPAPGDDADPMTAMHRDFDAFLAALLERVERRAAPDAAPPPEEEVVPAPTPQTVLLVVSDHGHSPTIVHSMDTQHRHGPDGTLVAFGGPVRAGSPAPDAPAPTLYDLLPTVLYLLDLPVPEDAAGRVLVELFEPSFVAAHPIKTVPSYAWVQPQLAGQERDAAANREQLRRLRELGYIQ